MSTTVKRKVYNTAGSHSYLGLPYKTVTQVWDGKITWDEGSLDDAFDEKELNYSGSSKNMVALAGEIALVQQQERCVVDGLTGTADPEDAEKAECLAVPGFVMEAVTDGEGKVQYRLPVDEDGNPVFTDTTVYVEMGESTALATALGVDRLFLFPASKAVSFMGTLSGVSVLCDRRKSMAGYSVSGATEVAWVPVPWSWWTSAKVQAVRTELLTALKIEDYGNTDLVSDLCQGITVEDGVLSGDVELADKQRLFFVPNGVAADVRQFGEVTVDGSSQLTWLGNKSFVVALFAAVPKVSMQSVLGLAAVFVGINGGVPEWMVPFVKAGLASLITNLCSQYPTLKGYLTGETTQDFNYPIRTITALNTGLTTKTTHSIEVCGYFNKSSQSETTTFFSAGGWNATGSVYTDNYNKGTTAVVFVHNSTMAEISLSYGLQFLRVGITSGGTCSAKLSTGSSKTCTIANTHSGITLTLTKSVDYERQWLSVYDGSTLAHLYYPLADNLWYDIVDKKVFDTRS